MPKDDWQPLSKAATLAGVHRLTLGRWVKARKLRTRTGYVRNLKATLVNVADVKKLVGEGVRPGRPRKQPKEGR